MDTDTYDTLSDMQNATRELAEKISSRARQFETSADARVKLYEWARAVNNMANLFAKDMAA